MKNESTLPTLIALMLFQPWWCIRSKPTTEQVKDTGAMVTCVANHWGEDWAKLIADCAGQGLELFYDIVAENEKNAIATTPEDAGPSRKTLSSSPNPAASVDHRETDKQAPKGSYYATQTPIAIRLLNKDGRK